VSKSNSEEPTSYDLQVQLYGNVQRLVDIFQSIVQGSDEGIRDVKNDMMALRRTVRKDGSCPATSVSL